MAHDMTGLCIHRADRAVTREAAGRAVTIRTGCSKQKQPSAALNNGVVWDRIDERQDPSPTQGKVSGEADPLSRELSRADRTQTTAGDAGPGEDARVGSEGITERAVTRKSVGDDWTA